MQRKREISNPCDLRVVGLKFDEEEHIGHFYTRGRIIRPEG